MRERLGCIGQNGEKIDEPTSNLRVWKNIYSAGQISNTKSPLHKHRRRNLSLSFSPSRKGDTLRARARERKRDRKKAKRPSPPLKLIPYTHLDFLCRSAGPDRKQRARGRTTTTTTFPFPDARSDPCARFPSCGTDRPRSLGLGCRWKERERPVKVPCGGRAPAMPRYNVTERSEREGRVKRPARRGSAHPPLFVVCPERDLFCVSFFV